jgi:serine/threonine protein kinase
MTANIKMLHACSFCGKNQTQVKTLVSGNGAFICNECVDLCLDVIRPKVEAVTKTDVHQLTPPQIVSYLDEHVIGQDEAVKKISKAFDEFTLAKRTLREIKILKMLKYENIISLYKLIRLKTEDRDVYIVLDLMETDLHRVIYSDQQLNEKHIK